MGIEQNVNLTLLEKWQNNPLYKGFMKYKTFIDPTDWIGNITDKVLSSIEKITKEYNHTGFKSLSKVLNELHIPTKYSETLYKYVGKLYVNDLTTNIKIVNVFTTDPQGVFYG